MGTSNTKPTVVIHGLEASGKTSILYYVKYNKWHKNTTKLKISKNKAYIEEILKNNSKISVHDIKYDTKNSNKLWNDYCETEHISALIWTVNYNSSEESIKKSSKLFWDSLIEFDGGLNNKNNPFPILIFCTNYDLFKVSQNYKNNMFNHHKIVEIFELQEFVTYNRSSQSNYAKLMYQIISQCLKTLDMPEKVSVIIMYYLIVEFNGTITKSCSMKHNHKFAMIFCSKDTNDKEFGIENINYGFEWLMNQKNKV